MLICWCWKYRCLYDTQALRPNGWPAVLVQLVTFNETLDYLYRINCPLFCFLKCSMHCFICTIMWSGLKRSLHNCQWYCILLECRCFVIILYICSAIITTAAFRRTLSSSEYNFLSISITYCTYECVSDANSAFVFRNCSESTVAEQQLWNHTDK